MGQSWRPGGGAVLYAAVKNYIVQVWWYWKPCDVRCTCIAVERGALVVLRCESTASARARRPAGAAGSGPARSPIETARARRADRLCPDDVKPEMRGHDECSWFLTLGACSRAQKCSADTDGGGRQPGGRAGERGRVQDAMLLVAGSTTSASR